MGSGGSLVPGALGPQPAPREVLGVVGPRHRWLLRWRDRPAAASLVAPPLPCPRNDASSRAGLRRAPHSPAPNSAAWHRHAHKAKEAFLRICPVVSPFKLPGTTPWPAAVASATHVPAHAWPAHEKPDSSQGSSHSSTPAVDQGESSLMPSPGPTAAQAPQPHPSTWSPPHGQSHCTQPALLGPRNQPASPRLRTSPVRTGVCRGRG